MPDLSIAQLQAIVVQLDQALYIHEQWLKDLMRVVVVRIPPDAGDLLPDAHRRCRLGQWLYSDATATLHDRPAFLAIDQAHQQMHQGAARLLQRSGDGLPITTGEMDQLLNAIDRLRREIQSLRGELAEQIDNRDPLTGARNRASLFSGLREQQALVRRVVQRCALAMIDLDHFKLVNDRYGHAAGDAVLVATVHCLQENLRPYDRLYRYGGEEFLLCMADLDVEGALGMTERLREAVAAQKIPFAGESSPLTITASFGVALLDAASPIETSIDRADKALFQAKAAGRNCVVAWQA